MDDDWRHGMYQGPLVVQYREWTQDELEAWGWYGIVDHVARFETSTGDVGYGLHEHGFFGPFPKYGLERSDDGAPSRAVSRLSMRSSSSTTTSHRCAQSPHR